MQMVHPQKSNESNCYGLLCVSPKFGIKALTPTVIAFGDRAFKKLLSVRP